MNISTSCQHTQFERLLQTLYPLSRLSEYLARIAMETGVSLAKVQNVRNQVKLTVAVASEATLNVVLKTPKVWCCCRENICITFCYSDAA